MGPGLRIRAVRRDEVEALHTIRLRALRESPGAFGSTYEAEIGRDPATRLRWLVGGIALVAEDPEGWQGLTAVRFDDHDRDRVDILSMWVAPERRHEGLGTALLRAALDWARSNGARTARLGVVEGNEGALALYRAHGFVPNGERGPLLSDPTRHVVYLALSLR